MLRLLAVCSCLFLTGCFNTAMYYMPFDSNPKAAYALESIEGVEEGTWRANWLMGVDTKRVPWCGHAAKYAVEKAGHKAPRHYASAAAWETWGRRVSTSRIERGDVIVFRSSRSRSGRHVAIATDVKRDKVKVCGGNTRNRVHCGWRSKSRITAARRG